MDIQACPNEKEIGILNTFITTKHGDTMEVTLT